MYIYSKRNPPVGYYVYAYLRDDKTPYYIGKGTNKRAWDPNHSVNLPHKDSDILILESNLTNVGAFALERRYIKWYGRKDLGTGVLLNKTEGGEGPSTLDRIGCRNPMFGKKQSEYQKCQQSVLMRGVEKSLLTRERMSDAKQGMHLGLSNPNADSSEYQFSNTVTGEVITVTQFELRKRYNLDQGNVSKLVSGRYKSTQNWILLK